MTARQPEVETVSNGTNIRTIGVVGAGTMGQGIAQVAIQAGYRVRLVDVTPELVDKARDRIAAQLARGVEKGRMSQADADAALARLATSADRAALAEADFVIEAVTEQLPVKLEVFAALDEICRPGVILASNTSGLSITAMAGATRRPEAVVGMHFFNPAPVMKLVEVVRAAHTAPETLATTVALAKALGKEPITVEESPLFVVNRILCPMINEAIFALQEGVASAEDIDRAMVLGANHPIGPLALADLVGLDTLLFVLETLHQETGDPKYRPAPLLRKLVRAGRLGRKSGQGFFSYST
ncbi:MAG TPA: 3-hydroxybutyryl-CoA dehydrogenase [Limnochordales bacterium]|nr:3-hydroxybutyryl-CoA dehydrogenase [Limnochordales bacterium]